MDASFLARIRPWLLSLAVTLVLVLAFTAIQRVKRSTVEGQFNYIPLGMDQKRVHEILGPSLKSSQATPRNWNLGTWNLENYTIEIGFDEGERVISKILRRK